MENFPQISNIRTVQSKNFQIYYVKNEDLWKIYNPHFHRYVLYNLKNMDCNIYKTSMSDRWQSMNHSANKQLKQSRPVCKKGTKTYCFWSLCGSFFFSFSCSQVVMKKSSNDNFFGSKRDIGWKNHHLSEIWQCFHSNNDVFPLKSKRTRVRKRGQEEKGTTNSAPKFLIHQRV